MWAGVGIPDLPSNQRRGGCVDVGDVMSVTRVTVALLDAEQASALGLARLPHHLSTPIMLP